MIQERQLAYYGRISGSHVPLSAANQFQHRWDKVAMLWGDQVYVDKIAQGAARVSTKGHFLEIDLSDLMETPILSIYQIDVGQGDSALIHTPDDRWLMIDGGPGPKNSNSGKGAYDFLFWKMFVDQSWRKEFEFGSKFSIDALVCTHPDADHFGGFSELMSQVDTGQLQINTVYHGGMARYISAGGFTKFDSGAGFSQLGPVAGSKKPDVFLTTLIDTFDDVRTFLDESQGRDWKLADGGYRKFLADLLEREGEGIGSLRRVHHGIGYLPGYEPGVADFSFRILGPFEEQHNGQPALRFLDSTGEEAMKKPSLTRNGHSVVLRCDYDRARVLFTGDLNFNSQALLLSRIPEEEFWSHVVKACHHGAEDISFRFLQAKSHGQR